MPNGSKHSKTKDFAAVCIFSYGHGFVGTGCKFFSAMIVMVVKKNAS